MIGVVVAETEALARLAAKLVVVEYGEELPVVMSCEEAIEAGQYFDEYEVCMRREVKRALVNRLRQCKGG